MMNFTNRDIYTLMAIINGTALAMAFLFPPLIDWLDKRRRRPKPTAVPSK